VLGSTKELYKVIKGRLREFKKKFQTPRRTLLINATTSDYIEEVKVEDIYVLIDRFGYTKSVDNTSYSRASEDSLNEYSHIIQMKNTDKLCCFTDQGNMHQVKAENIPRCKMKDRGTLIHNLCKLDNETVVLFTSFEELFEGQLLFTTKNGYIKQVSGAEFETNRSQINATKLEEDDQLVSVKLLSAGDILANNRKVILYTEKGLSLGFPLSEVSELKKNSRGVKAITLEKNDYIVYADAVEPNTETFTYNDKEYSAKKIRNRHRGDKGQRAQIEIS
jgi:DNA gyrase subunit A